MTVHIYQKSKNTYECTAFTNKCNNIHPSKTICSLDQYYKTIDSNIKRIKAYLFKHFHMHF